MAKNTTRLKYVCDQFQWIIDEHYDSDADAIRKLDTNPHTLAKLKSGQPVKKSTALRVLKRHRDISDREFDPHSAIRKIETN